MYVERSFLWILGWPNSRWIAPFTFGFEDTMVDQVLKEAPPEEESIAPDHEGEEEEIQEIDEAEEE